MLRLSIVLLLSILLLSHINASEKPVSAPNPEIQISDVTTVFLIRHAEKEKDTGSNPMLTTDGVARAKNWAEIFSSVDLDQVYSTDTKRTLETARPVARSQNLSVQIMPASPKHILDLVTPHNGKSIVMVGHSNTVPLLVNQMIGEPRFEDLDESNYSSLFIVTLDQDSASAMRLNIR